jgi:hypothetical protein
LVLSCFIHHNLPEKQKQLVFLVEIPIANALCVIIIEHTIPFYRLSNQQREPGE